VAKPEGEGYLKGILEEASLELGRRWLERRGVQGKKASEVG